MADCRGDEGAESFSKAPRRTHADKPQPDQPSPGPEGRKRDYQHAATRRQDRGPHAAAGADLKIEGSTKVRHVLGAMMTATNSDSRSVNNGSVMGAFSQQRSLGPPIVRQSVGWAKPVLGCDPWLRRGGFETRPYMLPRRPLGLSCPASSGASSNPRRAR